MASHARIDPRRRIGYHGRMRLVRRAGILLLVTGLAACATGTVERVPLNARLEGLYGHQLDVTDPPHPPRNPRWENARLDVLLRVGRYLEDHPELPPAIADALARHELIIGLTKAQVQLLWGPPDRTQHDIWYYRLPHARGIGAGSCHIFFQHGVITRITAPRT